MANATVEQQRSATNPTLAAADFRNVLLAHRIAHLIEERSIFPDECYATAKTESRKPTQRAQRRSGVAAALA